MGPLDHREEEFSGLLAENAGRERPSMLELELVKQATETGSEVFQWTQPDASFRTGWKKTQRFIGTPNWILTPGATET